MNPEEANIKISDTLDHFHYKYTTGINRICWHLDAFNYLIRCKLNYLSTVPPIHKNMMICFDFTIQL